MGGCRARWERRVTEGGTRVGVIGVGNLGTALVAGWLRPGGGPTGAASPRSVTVFDNDPVRCGSLVAGYRGARAGRRLGGAAGRQRRRRGGLAQAPRCRRGGRAGRCWRRGRLRPSCRPPREPACTGCAPLSAPGPISTASCRTWRWRTGEGVIALAPDEGTPPERSAAVKALFAGPGRRRSAPRAPVRRGHRGRR